jgi:fumarylacetoacetase
MGLIKSWVASANDPESDFPLNNLPYGVFSTGGARRCGVAIGDMILDVSGLGPAGVFDAGNWNGFMALGPAAWADFRAGVTAILAEGAAERPLVAQADATLHMPFAVAEYTDFYAGRHHAENMGEILRGAKALPANWLHMPIGYNGRASSVVVSGTPVRRPLGQLGAGRFGPSERLDIELELGAVVGQPSGGPVSTAEADEMIFGFVLLNDWSARDIQAWEYQPLGPFQGKAFATSISPWIVPKAALEAFRRPAPAPAMPYLREARDGLYDIELSVYLGDEQISRTNATELHYSAAQQLAHHSIGGCPMRVGDLLGSGTISGPTPESYGSLMELSRNGEKPLQLANGARRFIEDGDRLVLKGHAQGAGFRIGFGAVEGTILPAIDTPDWAR